MDSCIIANGEQYDPFRIYPSVKYVNFAFNSFFLIMILHRTKQKLLGVK